jgi:hypothetical protein
LVWVLDYLDMWFFVLWFFVSFRYAFPAKDLSSAMPLVVELRLPTNKLTGSLLKFLQRLSPLRSVLDGTDIEGYRTWFFVRSRPLG